MSEAEINSQDDAAEAEANDQKRPSGKKRQVNVDQLISHFSACGRCSFFLTGYRVLQGVDDLETAVAKEKGRWVRLTWNHEMRDLVSKSYGVHLYIDFYHYDGRCPECGRHFIYESDPDAEQESFRIALNRPR